MIIWGAGGHAKVVADIVRKQNLEVEAFVNDLDEVRGDSLFCGARVVFLHDLSALHQFRSSEIIIGIGRNAVRSKLGDRAKSLGFRLAIAVHPKAIVADDVTIREGTVVMGGAIINPGSSLGACVVVNTGATVDHDCIIHDGVSICPGVHLGGHVEVGRGAWVGIGAIVRERISIGECSVIGAGAVVVRDVPPSVVVAGVPARIIRGVRDDD